VPEIYDYDFSGKIDDAEYILMNKIDGVPLSEVFWKLTREKQINYIEQIANILKELHQFTYDDIGSFNQDMDIVKIVDTTNGPFNTFSEYAACDIESRANFLQEQNEFLDFIHPLRDYASSIRYFKDNSPFVLTHGDFDLKNIMVKDDKITGVLDFEWSGSFPKSYELNNLRHDLHFEKNDFLQLAFEKIYEEKINDLIPDKIKEIYDVMGLSMTLTAYKNWFKEDELEKQRDFIEKKKQQLSLILGM